MIVATENIKDCISKVLNQYKIFQMLRQGMITRKLQVKTASNFSYVN